MVCDTCGESFGWHGRGRKPKYCPLHRPSKNKSRDVERMRKNFGEEAAKEFAKQAGHSSASEKHLYIKRAVLPELMAVGLSRTDDPMEAAALMGCFDIPEAEILEAAELAREKHAALTELRSAAIGKATLETIAQIVLYTKTMVPSMAPQQVAPVLKTLLQAHELLTGGGDAVFSNIVMAVAEYKPGE